MTTTDQDRAIQRIAEEYDRVTVRQNAGPTKDRAVVVCPDGRAVVLDGDGEVIADSRKKAESSGFPSIGCHCVRCGVEYETPSRPNCECAGEPPIDHDSLEYEGYLDRVRRLRYDRPEVGA